MKLKKLHSAVVGDSKKYFCLDRKVTTVSNDNRRMTRENKTIEAMVNIYCHGQHGSKDVLCSECRELLDYAKERLDKCPLQEGKTTCAKCPVHCYKTVMREKVRVVMQYAGPRMLYRHPILTLYHLIDGLGKEPVRPSRKENGL